MYQAIFGELGIGYESGPKGGIAKTAPLRHGRDSLQLYFHQANKNGPDYFVGRRRYQAYPWQECWVQAEHRDGRDQERGHLAIRPKPGQERKAVEDILRYGLR